MKNKKFLLVVMIALMAMLLVACGSEPAQTPGNTPVAEADYSGSVTDWMYEPESEDELIALLVTIDRTPYGSAGSSLQQVHSAVSLMKLAMDESGNAEETVKTYLEGMNDTQRDFFSFQWEHVQETANALMDGSLDAAILEDAGDADFDLKAVDSEKVKTLTETVTNLLRDAGVTDEWKNHTDLEPFSSAGA